eukprot:COSAG04_NODE_3500_length_2767_cov_30.138172_2_plen_521_part_00
MHWLETAFVGKPHLTDESVSTDTLESFIVIALLLYQLHMTLFVLSRVDLGSEVVTASSLALLFIMAGLLILSFVFYMGILQRALCPYSDGWRLSASLEKMAEAGEKLRGSLVEGMGNGGVLRQVLRTIDRTVSQSPAVPAEAESKVVEPKAEADKSANLGASGAPKHRRAPSDGSEGGDAPLSVYSKALQRWVGADASQHITVDKRGTPHKNRTAAKTTPTNTSGVGSAVRPAGTDSVKKRLRFLRPSPSPSPSQFTLPRETPPRVGFDDTQTSLRHSEASIREDAAEETQTPAGLELQLDRSLGASPFDMSDVHDSTHVRLQTSGAEEAEEEDEGWRRRRRRGQSFSRRPRKLSVVNSVGESGVNTSMAGSIAPTPRETPLPSPIFAQPEPEPEPEPQAEDASSEDDYDAAPPGPSPGSLAGSTPGSVLKQRRHRSTSLETSVVGPTGSAPLDTSDAVNASALSDGGVAALTGGRESIGASGGRAEGTSLQRRQRRAYLKLLAAIELRRGTSQRCDQTF